MNRTKTVTWMMALVVSSSGPAVAEELDDLKAQFRSLQQQMEQMRKRIESLEAKRAAKAATKKPETAEDLSDRVTTLEDDLSFVKDEQSALSQAVKERLEMHFYTSLAYEDFENSVSAFKFHDVELLGSGRLTDRLRVYTQLDFEAEGDIQKIEIEEAFAEFSLNSAMTFRGGVQIVPFGRFNMEHFPQQRDLTNFPLVNRRIVPVVWSEAGLGLVGDVFLGDAVSEDFLPDLSLNYRLMVMNGLTNDLSDTGTRLARGGLRTDNNNDKAFAGRIGTSPVQGQEVGLSGYFGDYDDQGHGITGLDVDWKLTRGPFEFLGEYAFFDLEEGGFTKNTTQAVPGFLSGWFAQINYRFWFDFLNDSVLGRGLETPTFTGILRYGRADIRDDGDAGTGNNREQRWTLGLNYRPTARWVVKLEYQFNKTLTEALERGDDDGLVFSVSASF